MKPPIYSKKSARAINGMDSPTKQRIKAGIEDIPNGDIKPLQGAPGTYRLRIGDWRILFSYADESKDRVKVKKVSPRGEAYKGV